jgi:predicted Zn-dependent peptidase
MASAMSWNRNTLRNGLVVILYPRQSANTTQLAVAVKYGSNQEPPEKAGVAHFLEHMIAGGSEKRIQLSRRIENSGGILDLYTDHEHTMCTMDFMPIELENASSSISELLFDREFEREKFEKERIIILNELAEAQDDPAEKIEELLLKSLFKSHPVRRPVGGYPKEARNLTLDQLRNAHDLSYVSENMILVLSGTFSDLAMDKAVNFFEKKPAQKFSRINYSPEATSPKPLVIRKKAGISQTYLSIGARTVSSTHRDMAALNLISAVLSGGTSSRLFIELRERNALTYDVSSNHSKGVDFGYFSINCAVKNKNLVKARKLILSELSKLCKQTISKDELQRNKNLIVGGILRGMDNPQEALEIITYLETQYKSGQALEDYVAKISAVTSEDIKNVANIYLKEDLLSTVILQPKK